MVRTQSTPETAPRRTPPQEATAKVLTRDGLGRPEMVEVEGQLLSTTQGDKEHARWVLEQKHCEDTIR